jgi:hypothetical protein
MNTPEAVSALAAAHAMSPAALGVPDDGIKIRFDGGMLYGHDTVFAKIDLADLARLPGAVDDLEQLMDEMDCNAFFMRGDTGTFLYFDSDEMFYFMDDLHAESAALQLPVDVMIGDYIMMSDKVGDVSLPLVPAFEELQMKSIEPTEAFAYLRSLQVELNTRPVDEEPDDGYSLS